MENLIQILSAWTDIFFLFCVYAIQLLANTFYISYEAMNILLFVIIQPALIVFFAYKYYKLKAKAKQ